MADRSGAGVALASVRVRVLSYPTEDEARVKALVASLAPGAGIVESRADATHGGDIRIFESRLSRRRETGSFFRRLPPEILEELASSVEKRMDADGHLFFRFDKQELALGRMALAAGGDTVAVECAVHGPRSRSAEVFRRVLEEAATVSGRPAPDTPS